MCTQSSPACISTTMKNIRTFQTTPGLGIRFCVESKSVRLLMMWTSMDFCFGQIYVHAVLTCMHIHNHEKHKDFPDDSRSWYPLLRWIKKCSAFNDVDEHGLLFWDLHGIVLSLVGAYFDYLTNWAASWQNQQNDCAPSEDSDQPGHQPSLIRVFAVCSMGS